MLLKNNKRNTFLRSSTIIKSKITKKTNQVELFRKYYKIIKYYLPHFFIIILLIFALFFVLTTFENSSEDFKPKRRSSREINNEQILNKINKCFLGNRSKSEQNPFPADLFTLQQRRKGAVVLDFFGLIYMFIALAIVCDEFFVPSLGVITEMLEISDDVAGATFMAAGGSAPEFFTSLFGVFITENNVGVGTIVGSATFNILCVLSFCTLFSRNVLSLTWWPLYRDITFYGIAILCLSFFFLDERIYWTEALAMFAFYIIYAIFMKYNSTIERWVKRRLNLLYGVNIMTTNGITPKVSGGDNNNPTTPSDFSKNKINEQTSQIQIAGGIEVRRPLLHAGGNFPEIYPGILQLAMDPNKLLKDFGTNSSTFSDSTRIVRKRESADHIILLSRRNAAITARGHNKGRRSSRRLDKSCSLPSFAHALSSTTTIAAKNENIKTILVLPANKGNNGILLNKGITNGLPPVNLVTTNKNLLMTGSSQLQPVEEDNNKNVTDYQKNEFNCENDNDDSNGNNISSPEVFIESGVIEVNKEEEKEEEQQQEYVDLSWPKTFYKKCVFLFLAPIMFPLAYTLPDVKREDRKKYAAFTFVGSVIWIALFTYLMVWWASIAGLTLGIPTEVIGLTALAAGTSIPDLITSVIVSRKGLGDMAVSSSIGSNLFDICVGLPIPWLLHFLLSAAKKGLKGINYISVGSNGLLCSIGILFLMLIVLIVSVAITRWKMSKLFGAIMLFAYVFFCVFSVLMEKSLIICPLNGIITNQCRGK